MSIINKMLRDLDKRPRALQRHRAATQGMSQHAHAVAPRAFASIFLALHGGGDVVRRGLGRLGGVAADAPSDRHRPRVSEPAGESRGGASISDPAPPRQAAAVLPATPKPEPGPAVPQR